MKNTDKITLQSTVQRAGDPLSASIEDELVILDNSNNHYYGLEAVGTRVWTLLEEPIPLHKLVDIICNEYEVAPQVFGKDCVEFIETLQEKGLVSTTS